MGSRQAPVSDRFRRVAAAVVDDACEHLGGVPWVVTRADDGAQVVVWAGCEEATGVQPGDTIRPDPATDLVLPVELPDGSPFGALCGLGAGEGNYDAPAAAKVIRLAALLGEVAAAEWEIAQQASRAEAAAVRASRVEQESLTDSLTGLANRRAWDRALEAEEKRRRRYGGPAAVVIVDLDDLKKVNDSQGHLSGDLLLRLVGRVIADASRDSDVVARTGGDEFAVLALDCDGPQLGVLVSRLREALDVEGVAASVGGASRRPDAGMAEAWAEADEVMYAEKARRKGLG